MNEVPAAERRHRRAWFIVTGLIVMVVGLAAAVGLWLAASQRLDDAVEGLARAPVGCDTVLDFDSGGTYIMFIETEGQIDEVRGDCEVAGDFTWDGAGGLPVATLTLTDPDGNEVALSPNDDASYDVGGSVGASVQSVEIDEGGDHTLRVESADSGFAVSVGRNPNDGVAAMRLGAVAAALVGLIVGGGLIILGLRHRVPTADEATPWIAPPSGVSGWPSSPPGFPAPPATTGATAAVGPPTAPPIRVPTSPLPMPPDTAGSIGSTGSTGPSGATGSMGPPGSIGSTRWDPPPPAAQ